MFSYCLSSFILTVALPVYSTRVFDPLTLCALPSGQEGRVQLLCDVSDMLALSVNTALLSQCTKKRKKRFRV